MKTLTAWEEILISESLKQYKNTIIEDIERNKRSIKQVSELTIILGLEDLNRYLTCKLRDVESLISKLEE